MFLTLFCFQAICCSSLVAKHKKKLKKNKTFSQSQEVTLLFTLLSTSTFSLAQSSLKSFAVKCQLCDILNWYKNYTLLVVFFNKCDIFKL